MLVDWGMFTSMIKFGSLGKRKVSMPKARILPFSILFWSQLSIFGMEQQLMYRHNAGKTDDLRITAKQDGNFFDRTISTIKQEKCPVCYDSLEKCKGALIILGCHHALHSYCCETLKKGGYSTCPTCRKPLEIFDNSEETPNCCISGIEIVTDTCIHEIKYSTLSVTRLIYDLTNPHMQWSDIHTKALSVSDKINDNELAKL